MSRVFALVVSALFGGAVHALPTTTTATASFRGFEFKIIDLDLNDGVPASFTFSGAVAHLGTGGTWGGQNMSTGWTGEPITNSSISSYGSGSASVTSGSLTASASVDTGIERHALGSATLGSMPSYAFPFTVDLTANTTLRLTGTVDLSLVRAPRDYGVANFWITSKGGIADQSFSRTVNSISSPDGGTLTEFVTFDITNASSTSANRSLSIRVQALAVAAIPEPSTYLLMVMGLGVAAAATRRRTKC